MKAFPRPQRKQRFFCLVENLGFFLLLAMTDVFAIPFKNLINKTYSLYKSADFPTGQIKN